MSDRYVFAPLLALSFSIAGCEVDDSVVLEASISQPMVTVTAHPLATEVTGSFGLELSLGEYASDPTSVKIGVFSLKRGSAVLLSPLELEPSPPFPITVGPGTEKHVNVVIGDPEAEPELAAELCAGELQIAGSLTDSLTDDRPRPVTSSAFSPSCL